MFGDHKRGVALCQYSHISRLGNQFCKKNVFVKPRVVCHFAVEHITVLGVGCNSGNCVESPSNKHICFAVHKLFYMKLGQYYLTFDHLHK